MMNVVVVHSKLLCVPGTAPARTSCVFPFQYAGDTYDDCTTADNNGVPWCYADEAGATWGNCDYCSYDPDAVVGVADVSDMSVTTSLSSAGDFLAYADCKHALENDASSGDGWYMIDPTGGDVDDAFEAYCIMEDNDVGGGWTLIAKVTSNDVALSWNCQNTPGCRGSLWNNNGLLNEDGSRGFDADEDAKYAAYNSIAADDLMFYDIANGYPLVMVNSMLAGRTLQQLIDQVPDQGACTCCSQVGQETYYDATMHD